MFIAATILAIGTTAYGVCWAVSEGIARLLTQEDAKPPRAAPTNRP